MKKIQSTVFAAIVCSLIGVNGSYAAQSSQHLKNIQNQQDSEVDIDILINGNFQGDTGWWASGGTFNTQDQMGCITFTNGGENPWDVVLGQSNLKLLKDQIYTLRFSAMAKNAADLKAVIQHDGEPYTNYLNQTLPLTNTVQSFEFQVKPSARDKKAQLAFQVGAQPANTVCLSDISLYGPQYEEEDMRSAVRVNQVGYLLNAKKRATIQTDTQTPLPWQLLDAQGTTIAEGQTIPFGLNSGSGEQVQIADFSQVQTPQEDIILEVDGQKSHPFDISHDIYKTMKYDALSFFYQQRSGTAIENAYVQRADLARPAGHPQEIVTCFNQTDAKGNDWPGCDFSLDVTGGWYDAGDHGKYVVNGGISVWTLMNYYERENLHKTNPISAFADGMVQIPEQSNQYNDLLDEAKWMMDFMLAMQVPAHKKVSVPVGDQSGDLSELKLTEIDAGGMVFHKIADAEWTGVPLPPHDDTQPRFLSYPSTAATLNLAATAAQCARIWRPLNATYADKCLSAAEKAWQAANAHKNVYAYDNFNGSGPYGDTNVADEFYWAAAELFVTTGKDEYKTALEQSPYYLTTPTTSDDLTWSNMGSAGTVSLALLPNNLDKSTIEKARANLLKTADIYEASVKTQGYLIPYQSDQYPWGSNSNIMNRSIFLGLAFDWTKTQKYLQAMSDSMDYILGRNPMDHSYVSGYGTYPLLNPHHRFWAHSENPDLPIVPPGVISGGPNSIDFSDPVAATLKGNCTGQTCWIDDIGAWTMNEVTVNWNAPFFWVVSFLDEHASW